MKKILLVEDDEAILANVEFILTEHGYNIVTAKDGIWGFETAKKELPDLIISDILMPGIDGFELKKRIDSDKKTKSIPFIFLTAKTDIQDLRAGMNLGADDYLMKPFKTEDLLKAIEARFKRVSQLDSGFGNKPNGKNKTHSLNRIMVNDKKEQILIKFEEIKYISAEGLYSKIYTADNKKFMLRKLLKDWEKILPEENFFRIHRSMIINLDYVLKVEKWFSRTYKVYLKGVEKPFDISQRFSVKLKERLSV